tara:strand:- start:20166 stop:20564 length:399 start_codon:yes stop_codon:yes gene_type:complete
MPDYTDLEANILQQMADRKGAAGGVQHLCEEAVIVWGVDAQIDMAIEECAELIVALNHYRRGRVTEEEVLGEVADVSILVEQMASLFGRSPFASIRSSKINKLATRLDLKESETGFRSALIKRIAALGGVDA